MRKFSIRVIIESTEGGPAVSSEIGVGIVQAESIDSLVKIAHGLGPVFGGRLLVERSVEIEDEE